MKPQLRAWSSGVIRPHQIPVGCRVRPHQKFLVKPEVLVERGEVQHIVDLAREISGLAFGVTIGSLAHGTDVVREQLLTSADPDASILVGIDPDQRMIVIVTGAYAQSRVNDQACAQAVLAMQSTMADGDLISAVRNGVLLLAEHARAPHTAHLGEPG
jgi:hypothetical protein